MAAYHATGFARPARKSSRRCQPAAAAPPRSAVSGAFPTSPRCCARCPNSTRCRSSCRTSFTPPLAPGLRPARVLREAAGAQRPRMAQMRPPPKAKRTLMFNFNNRARPSYAMMDYIAKGAVGRINSCQANDRHTGIPGFGWFDRPCPAAGPSSTAPHGRPRTSSWATPSRPRARANVHRSHRRQDFKARGHPGCRQGVTDVGRRRAACHVPDRQSMSFSSWAEMNKRESLRRSRAQGRRPVQRLFGPRAGQHRARRLRTIHPGERRPVNRSIVVPPDDDGPRARR